MDLEACVAETLDEDRAVGQAVGDDCVRCIGGMHGVFECWDRLLNRSGTLFECFGFQRPSFCQLSRCGEVWSMDIRISGLPGCMALVV